MTDLAIRVEQLGKSYRISHQAGGQRGRYRTLRDDLLALPRQLWGSLAGKNETQETVWALKDVSFDVHEGEVVGVIGRNGAGKSTLLKILSRITEPTTGQAEVYGRVGSLLEVGTGFHPELSGRENVFLSGAVLGMRRSEINRRFDEIVSFAEMEQFIDTPVKRYSSGMYMRLAFAVAAHLDPEILVVDEVLAVGDAEFQKKCLGKMGDVARSGRTVLFVSHNMGMINSLCQQGLLLESGKIAAYGPTSEVVLAYYNKGNSSPHIVDFSKSHRKIGDHLATLLAARIEDEQGSPVSEVDIRQPFRVSMQYELLQPASKPPFPNFHFLDERGEYVFVSSGSGFCGSGTDVGIYEAQCIVPGCLLNNGTYFVGLALTFMHQGVHVSFYERDGLSVSIRDPIDETLYEMRHGYSGAYPGPIRPQLEWMIRKIS